MTTFLAETQLLYSTVVIRLKLWKKKEREWTKERKQRKPASSQNIWYNTLHYVSSHNYFYCRPDTNGEKSCESTKEKKKKVKKKKKKEKEEE